MFNNNRNCYNYLIVFQILTVLWKIIFDKWKTTWNKSNEYIRYQMIPVSEPGPLKW